MGNSCRASTGNKYQVETDYDGGAHLSFRRHYNSDGIVRPLSQFGHGSPWRSDWDLRLEIHTYGALSTAIVYRADGKAYFYNEVNGVWVSDPDVREKLERLTDSSGTLTGWRYTRLDSTVEEYGAKGRISTVTDPQGRTLSFSHGSFDEPVQSVTGPFGHVLSFGYDSKARLQTLTTPGGEVYEYRYNANGALETVIYPDETPGDSTDNPRRTYHYENPSFPNHLTGITDENGDRFATFAYDANGRAQSTEHAVTDNVQPQEKFTLGYQ